jgi:hypothetical protein
MKVGAHDDQSVGESRSQLLGQSLAIGTRAIQIDIEHQHGGLAHRGQGLEQLLRLGERGQLDADRDQDIAHLIEKNRIVIQVKDGRFLQHGDSFQQVKARMSEIGTKVHCFSPARTGWKAFVSGSLTVQN